MSTTEAEHRLAIRALADDFHSPNKARDLLELTLRDPSMAVHVRDAVAPAPKLGEHERAAKAYDRHNLRMDEMPKSIRSPKDLPALVATLQSAADGWELAKAIGDGYGSANTGFTRGALLPLVGHLDRMLVIDASVLQQGVDVARLLRFEAGATLDQINKHLWQHSKALRSQPGFERLTFAGAMSSGGHGTGSWTGPLSAQVQSLHLLTVDERRNVVQLRIEPKDGISHPAKFAAKYPSIDLIQDDNVFHACTCAMGCLGVIYSITIAVRDAYNLSESRTKHSWAAIKTRLPQLLAEQGPGKRLHSHELWLNPYPVDGEERCLLIERAEVPDIPQGQRALGIEFGGAEPLSALLGWWTRNHPRAIPALLDAALSAAEHNDVVLQAPQAFSLGGPNHAPVFTASGGIPIARSVEVIDGLIALFQQRFERGEGVITGPIGLRFVKAARAHMSPAFGRDTCMIEISILEGTAQARETLRAFHDFIFERCAGRPHWGHVNATPGERLERLYPQLPAFMESYRVLNPNGFFDNAFTEQMGFRARLK